MNILSLFDGISCGRIAAEKAYISVDNYFSSEIDKYCIKCSKSNFTDIMYLGDINNLNCSKLPKIDLLIAGSPCQGFSRANRNSDNIGFKDNRSNLILKFFEIIEKINPSYYILENVVMKKEWTDIISLQLNKKPLLIDSSLLSAQTRKRYYWTNIECIKPIIPKDIFWKDIMEIDAKNVYYFTERRYNWVKNKKRFRIYNKDSKIKMQTVESSFYKGVSNQRCFAIEDIRGLRFISPLECERLQTIPDNYTKILSNNQRYKSIGNAFTVDIIAHIMRHI